MHEFFAATFAYPTVIFTALLGFVVVYWLLVIVGAVGLDALDLDVDVETDVNVDGAGDAGEPDVPTEGAHVVHHASFLSTMLNAFGLRTVPLSLVVSLLVFFGWLSTHLGTHYLMHVLGMGPAWLIGSGLLVGAMVVAMPLTAMIVRPLGTMLKVEKAITRKDLIGKIVRIDTSRVDARFGSALADDGGAGLIVAVRCDHDNALTRGDQAVVLAYDEAREAYEVAPLEDKPSDSKALAKE